MRGHVRAATIEARERTLDPGAFRANPRDSPLEFAARGLLECRTRRYLRKARGAEWNRDLIQRIREPRVGDRVAEP